MKRTTRRYGPGQPVLPAIKHKGVLMRLAKAEISNGKRDAVFCWYKEVEL